MKSETDISELQMLMLDLNPCICIVFSADNEPVECNATAISYLGYESKEALLSGFLPDLLKSIPPFQPDASPTIPFETRIQYVVEHGEHDFEMEIVLHGTRVPLRFILKKVKKDDTHVIVCFIVDTQALKEARNELIRNDLLMRQVNRVATKLLAADPEGFDTEIIRTLKSLSQGVNACQMAIMRNFEEKGEFGCRVLYNGNFNSATSDTKSGESNEIDYTLVPDWHKALAAGKTVSGSGASLVAFDREGYFPRGTKVFTMIPVFLQKSFWGVIVGAKSANNHPFTKAEERAIQSGGIIIVTAILRNQINKNLIAAHETAKASEKAKSEFLSRMSHEIRTPLNAIIGMTTISRKLDDFEQIQHNLQKVEIASNQLLNLVNDILDLSKIETGKLEIVRQPFDFMSMLQKIVEIHKGSMAEKNQVFFLDCKKTFDRYIVTDELRLSQVLINLMGNAIKFTSDEGEISLLVDYCEKKNTGQYMLHVVVKDKGIGISQEQQTRLFRSFEQADGSITRRFGGSGLGLVICRNIVELLGGSIRVESEEGKGSSFIFEIPFTWDDSPVSQNDAESCQKPEMYSWKGKHILLAEDIEINREVVLALLKGTGLEITCVENGAEAVARFTQTPEKYSLILMDIQMPIMDGLEASRQIRSLPFERAKTIPIIAMTANAFSSDVEKCLEAGMMGHVSKPIDLDVLLDKLAEYI